MARHWVRQAAPWLIRRVKRPGRRARRALARWARPRFGDGVAAAALALAVAIDVAQPGRVEAGQAAGAVVAGLLVVAMLWATRDGLRRVVAGAAGQFRSPMTSAGLHDGAAYERLCASRLQAAGWSVEVTGPGPDHGLDLIARRGGRVAVVQCKRHRRPVGARAVQEIVAARPLVNRGAVAAVVASSGFTRSARALAHVNGVALLSHDDLARWDAKPASAG